MVSYLSPGRIASTTKYNSNVFVVASPTCWEFFIFHFNQHFDSFPHILLTLPSFIKGPYLQNPDKVC